MTEKGCDNCYYSFFDERAYPCSLCIRGIERTDMWQPSKKTKAESITYNPTSVNNIWEKPTNPYIPNEQTEPEVDCSWK